MFIPLWAKALAATIALGAATAAGWHIRDYDYQKHLKADARAALEASEGAREVEGKNEQIASEIGQQVEQAKERIRYVDRIIHKEIPVYVSQEASDRCVVPDGAVRLLDAAASSNPPAPYAPGESPDAPSGVDLPEIVSSATDNYAAGNEAIESVKGWQAWYAEVVRNWPTK